MGFSSTTLLLLCTASIAFQLAAPDTYYNHMLSGDTLERNDLLVIEDDTYAFLMRGNCDLVLNHIITVLWSSHTAYKSTGCQFTLRRDGNLVISDFRNETMWESNTSGEDGEYILILDKNGNVALYKQPLWETGTGRIMVTAGNATATA